MSISEIYIFSHNGWCQNGKRYLSIPPFPNLPFHLLPSLPILPSLSDSPHLFPTSKWSNPTYPSLPLSLSLMPYLSLIQCLSCPPHPLSNMNFPAWHPLTPLPLHLSTPLTPSPSLKLSSLFLTAIEHCQYSPINFLERLDYFTLKKIFWWQTFSLSLQSNNSTF